MRAYGLSVQAEGLALPGARASQPHPAPELARVRVTRASLEQVHAAWSRADARATAGERAVGGRRVVTLRGTEGDVLVDWEGAGTFHLDSAGTTLLAAAPGDAERPPAAEWLRFLLDTVLTTVALRHGAEALHAGAVAIGGRAVAIAGVTGGGKSSLVAELLARGHAFVTDDVLALRRGADGGLLAEPGPAVLTLTAARPFGPAPAALGRELARVDGELWIEAAHTAPGPLPLRCCAFLSRGVGLGLAARPLRDGARTLLGNALVSGLAPARQAQRLDLFADLAREVPLLAITAPPDAPPETIAGVLEEALAGTPGGAP